METESGVSTGDELLRQMFSAVHVIDKTLAPNYKRRTQKGRNQCMHIGRNFDFLLSLFRSCSCWSLF